MPANGSKKHRRKVFTVLVICLLLLIGIYLNRSYARIFEYTTKFPVSKIQASFTLTEGEGKGILRYAALGDSLTYGFGASDHQSTYPYIFARKFLKKYKSVEISNLARPGAVSQDVLTLQLPEALEINPGFVTLMIGTNDVHDYISEKDFKLAVEKIVDSLQSNTQAGILLINIPYLGTDSLILPPFNYFMDYRIKRYNKILLEIAKSKNIKYFDLYTSSYKSFKDNQDIYYSYDGFHPSSAGYTFWGDLINAD